MNEYVTSYATDDQEELLNQIADLPGDQIQATPNNELFVVINGSSFSDTYGYDVTLFDITGRSHFSAHFINYSLANEFFLAASDIVANSDDITDVRREISHLYRSTYL